MNAVNEKKKVRGASMFFDSNDPTYKQKYFYHTFNRFLWFLFFSVDLGKVFWRGEKKNQNKTSLDFFRNCLHRRQSFPKYHNC